MLEPASLLIYGSDVNLIQTRRWVLEKVGYTIHTALGAPDFAEMLSADAGALIILCHSLSNQDRDAALATLEQRRPEIPRLILAADASAFQKREQDTVLSAFLDPKTLISTVRNMLQYTHRFATPLVKN